MRSTTNDLFAGILPFVHTAESNSFRAAARELGVTPSAVSKAIAKLEGDLGVRLLRRTSRSVTLTAEGDAFLGRCRDGVDQVRAAREAAMNAQHAPRGLLRVSLPLPLARLVVMPALPRLLGRHPALSVQAIVTDRHVDLVKERIDVAVRMGAPATSSLVARKLAHTRWSTVASPAYLARRPAPRTPHDLREHNCLKFVATSGRPVEWVFRASARTSSEPVRTAGNVLADYGEALVQAAVAGLGIVQAIDFMVQRELEHGELVEVLASHAAAGPSVHALTTSARRMPAKVRTFIDFMSETFRPPGRSDGLG